MLDYDATSPWAVSPLKLNMWTYEFFLSVWASYFKNDEILRDMSLTLLARSYFVSAGLLSRSRLA